MLPVYLCYIYTNVYGSLPVELFFSRMQGIRYYLEKNCWSKAQSTKTP